MIVVLDASVLIKWFIKEADSETALRFKTGIGEEAVRSILPALFDLGMEIITPSQQLLQDALHLSFATDLSVYDCIYLALANELGAKLITADKRIVRQAEPLSKVKLLS